MPYEYDALEPYIDGATMRVHHTGHHRTYVDKLNTALENYPDLQEKTVDELLKEISTIPNDIKQAVINNGGGHSNHSLSWTSMAPKSNDKLSEKFVNSLSSAFGSVEEFKELFNKTAMGIFGSGWVWLVVGEEGKLSIKTFPNQNSPIMDGDVPLLGLDVWEHAYYLRYQNRRQEYVLSWWNVVNWEEVNRRYFI